jgi:glutaredoxin-related protein
MQWLHRFISDNVVASFMEGTRDLGACGLCSTDCALLLNVV